MRIIEYNDQQVSTYGSSSPANFLPVPSAVTVGSFDGVHRGHRKIIARMAAVAQAGNLRSVVVTFEPHPRRVLKGAIAGPLGLLTTLDEKVALLEAEGVDLLVLVRFTPDFARQSSDDFIRNILVGLLGAKAIIVGYDHAFGCDRSGSRETLERLGSELALAVEVVDEVLIGNEHCSSTKIRRLLENGMVEKANEFLGSPYMITGKVVDGEKLGRKIGFPTVNLMLNDANKLLPHMGVYFAKTVIDGFPHKALMNIGVRPTLSSAAHLSLEAHILVYSGNLYGTTIQFSLLRFIREEKRFLNIDELKRQIEKDKKTVELYC